VAAGLVDFSLGTDTAGSGRVPAAFNNLVGLKPTRGLLSTRGVVPACRSLDCVSIFTRTCVQARRVLDVAESFDAEDPYSRARRDLPRPGPGVGAGNGFRLGIPAPEDLEFFGDADSERRFRAAVARAEAIGGDRVQIGLQPFLQAARLLYEGPWVAERLAGIKEFFARSPGSLLPVTRSIIGGAEFISAVSAFEGMYKLAALRRESERQWERMDVLLLPTAGTIYTIAEVEAEPLTLNRNLGYYTNFVNLLDLCALAVPNGFLPSGLPSGVTFVAPAGCDRMLLQIGEGFEGAAAGGEAS
jgi:allophanate hydrolase